MKDKFMRNLIFLMGIISIGLFVAPFIKKIEGFNNEGLFPKSVDKAILDDYPLINKNKTSDKNYDEIWWHYPVFSVGSYEQITNNLKYHYNPDNGTCIRADFCEAVYGNKKHIKSNIVSTFPPAEEGSGARVGYFRTEPNELYFSIPTNENILY